MKRYKSTKLSFVNDLWFDGYELFDGIIFFDHGDFQLTVFEVKNGKITKPYISPCQVAIDELLYSPITIDSSTFCNEDEDIYGCGTIPQLYQGKPYQGMSYTFKNEVCVFESYTAKNGETDSKIYWSDNLTNGVWQIEIQNYNKYPLRYCYYFNNGNVSLSYRYHIDKTNIIFLSIEYDPKSMLISGLSLSNDALQNRLFLKFPVHLPETFKFLENYENFIFGNDRFNVGLNIDPNSINNLFVTWYQNNAFQNVKNLYIKGIEGLKDFSIFNNQDFFGKLEQLRLDKNTPSEFIEKLKATTPKYEIILV